MITNKIKNKKSNICALPASAATAFSPIIESGELISELMRLTIVLEIQSNFGDTFSCHVYYLHTHVKY